MLGAVIFDTETTGFDKPQVIELAWAEWPDGGLSIKGEYFLPSKPIEWGAMATHNIVPPMLVGCRPYTEAKLPPSQYVIGHNVDFDCDAIALSAKAPKRICTLALCRKLWPDADSHKLSAMYYFLFGSTEASRLVVKGAHSACDDVSMTADILEKCCDALGTRDLATLYAESEDARIPRKWPFGKFKGAAIGAADRGYANWYRKCTDPPPDPYIMEALRRAGLL